jgi:uncharacterized protein YukJ
MLHLRKNLKNHSFGRDSSEKWGEGSTYKSLGLQNNNDSRFAIVINKKAEPFLTLPILSCN